MPKHLTSHIAFTGTSSLSAINPFLALNQWLLFAFGTKGIEVWGKRCHRFALEKEIWLWVVVGGVLAAPLNSVSWLRFSTNAVYLPVRWHICWRAMMVGTHMVVVEVFFG